MQTYVCEGHKWTDEISMNRSQDDEDKQTKMFCFIVNLIVKQNVLTDSTRPPLHLQYFIFIGFNIHSVSLVLSTTSNTFNAAKENNEEANNCRNNITSL